jgi:HK97 family phage prohead protease
MNIAAKIEEDFWAKQFFLRHKKLKDNSLYIEGYANMATMDRDEEIIPAQAWDLKSFNKAGVILFNHDQNKPIGKPVKVEVKNDGLYIKARISSSDDPEIAKIRDLIEDGVLNCFSVGFRAKDHNRLSGGALEITKAELFEVSVVSVPANADSVFKLSTKYLQDVTCNPIVEEYLEMKHANKVLAFREELKKKRISIKKAEEKLIEVTKMPEEMVQSLMAGDLDFSDEMTDVVKKVFGIELKEMKEDLEGNDTEAEVEDEPVQDPYENVDEPMKVEIVWSDEDLAAWKDRFGKEPAESVAGGENNPPAWVADKQLWEKAKRASEAAIGSIDYAFVVWWYLDQGGTRKSLEVSEEEKNAKPITVKQAMEPAPTAPGSTVPVAPVTQQETEQNPYLEQSKQTNVLLGLAINLLQTMSSQLEAMNAAHQMKPAEGISTAPAPMAESPMPMTETAKNIRAVSDYITKLDLRLKALDL